MIGAIIRLTGCTGIVIGTGFAAVRSPDRIVVINGGLIVVDGRLVVIDRRLIVVDGGLIIHSNIVVPHTRMTTGSLIPPILRTGVV